MLVYKIPRKCLLEEQQLIVGIGRELAPRMPITNK